MYELYYTGSKFIADEKVEQAHFVSLKENHDKIVGLLKACDFSLKAYEVNGSEITIIRFNDKRFKEKDEGTGFILCLHLFGYWLSGLPVDLNVESIRGFLHPILYAALIKALYYPTYEPDSTF